jgi:hypothetical protein
VTIHNARQSNPADPLPKAGPDHARELFKRFTQVAHGFNLDDVTFASVNLVINSLRQKNATRQRAEREFDELFGRLKSLLLEHYDGAGNRRSIFPHQQVIEVPLFDFRNKR